MKQSKRILIFVLALLGMGLTRIPVERSLQSELREAKLLPMSLEIDTRDRIGQTASAVALGGLRTLVATFLNFHAFNDFAEKRWDDLRATFNTMVDLAPNTRFYWQSGAWHMAYNAASYYKNDAELAPLRRNEAWRASVLQGREFLERGVRNNPTDPVLNGELGALLSDPNKFEAFHEGDKIFLAAAHAYDVAASNKSPRSYDRRGQLYALSRVPDRRAEALALAENLYHSALVNHTPNLVSLLFALHMQAKPAQDGHALALRIFRNEKSAYNDLALYWKMRKDRLPVDGIARELKILETNLQVPAEKSVFSTAMGPWLDR